MTLTDFLLARIAEDEAKARGASVMYRAIGEHENVYGEWVPIEPVGSADHGEVERTAGFYRERGARNVEVVVYYDPARVLAECEAKRRIVERHRDCGWGQGWCDDGGHTADFPDGGCPDLVDLALPYADHPDYDEEWRI